MAAFFVFVHHLTPSWLPKPLFNFFQEFHVGVPVFFVLSGFLICYRYYDNVNLKKNWYVDYTINRFARIFPLYLILTAIAVLFFKEGLLEFLLNISFLRGFFVQYIFTGIHQGWSLSVEECFYLLAPIIFMLNKRVPLIVQAFLVLLTGFVVVKIFSTFPWHSFIPEYMFMLSYTFFGRCFEFFAGIQLALWFKKNPEMLATNFSKTYLGITGILLIVLVLAEIKGGHRWGVHRFSGIFLNNFVLPIFICSMLAGLLTEKTKLRSLLQQPMMILLGKSSYAFYLLHFGFWHLLLVKAGITNFFIELSVTTLLAVLVYQYLEEPLNSYIRHWRKNVPTLKRLPVVVTPKRTSSEN